MSSPRFQTKSVVCSDVSLSHSRMPCLNYDVFSSTENVLYFRLTSQRRSLHLVSTFKIRMQTLSHVASCNLRICCGVGPELDSHDTSTVQAWGETKDRIFYEPAGSLHASIPLSIILRPKFLFTAGSIMCGALAVSSILMMPEQEAPVLAIGTITIGKNLQSFSPFKRDFAAQNI